jgi:CBS domain-containing protein
MPNKIQVCGSLISVTVKSLAKPVVSLESSKTARQAAELMLEKNMGSVVVSDLGVPVGMVTERDLLRKVTAHSKDPDRVRLKEIMSSPLIMIEASEGLGEATSLMLEKGIRRLLVVEKGKIIGIFTQRDLQEKVLDVFTTISNLQRSV